MDACTRSMASISSELEEAYRKIAKLSQTRTGNSNIISTSVSVPTDRNDEHEYFRKNLELDTKEEIIKVLREVRQECIFLYMNWNIRIFNIVKEHFEGTRIIVEKDQKITELEQIMIGLERVEVNNC
uniref:YaaK family protein n=1 Tax=Heterorhabditis bacteriophora TaxID=37862 RepID=A0A1I7WN60_HETBA